MALLELHDVRASYGAIRALHGVSLKVEEGSVVALLGANGAGKTTTLRAITGMVKTTGEITFAGRSITGRSPEEVARMGIAHVPSGRGTMTQLTVWENLQMGAYIRRDRVKVKADYEKAMYYFPWIRKRRDQVAATLSGGEQQMLAIARALMLSPRLLLLDEPSLGLAPLVVRQIFALVRGLVDSTGLAVLLVEQNAKSALSIADTGVVLNLGKVVATDDASTLAADEQLRHAYLGF